MEFEKVNAIVSASEEAGYWVETMDDLLTHTSDEQSANRRRLWSSWNWDLSPGSCGNPYVHCENNCYGRCGPGCECWKWFCGDCNCWKGCESHDYYCSCHGMWHPCCFNV